ncbi:unnamed protein product [Mytilus edulis]|uniref:Uncharacterized protein n=1 Tax=Mytilus edulis TaxID=6550 RepID=A0A8S3UKK8_MYTED|nr:unnamed protein product [Mytilus edulis]
MAEVTKSGNSVDDSLKESSWRRFTEFQTSIEQQIDEVTLKIDFKVHLTMEEESGSSDRIETEPQEEFDIRLNLALTKFQSEIAILRLRVPKYKAIVEKVDNFIQDEMKKRSSGKIQEKLLELWQADTQREQEKSERILESKNEWFDKYEENYGNEPVKSISPKKRKVDKSTGNKNNTRRQSFPRSRSRSRSVINKKSYASVVKNERKPSNNRAEQSTYNHPDALPQRPRRQRQNRNISNERQRNANTYQRSRDRTPNPENNNHFLREGQMWKKRKKKEIKLLEHGLKFTPTPISDNVDLITDTDEFCRKLRLREFFGNTNYEDGSLVRNKKGTNPQPNRDKHLEEYINCLKQTANTNIVDSHVKSNLPKSQQKTIKKLQNDESIIIKEADKGGGIVIMDKDHYKDMVLNQLEDGVFYQKLNGNRDKSTMSKIRKLIKEYSDNLTDKEKDYLKNFEVKTSNFYGLPKIHKSKEIQDHVENCDSMYIKINRPTDLKIRPIIAGPSCSTQRLSNLLDILLKPLCIKVPSFVRDDMDFLNYIPDRVPLDTILVTFRQITTQVDSSCFDEEAVATALDNAVESDINRQSRDKEKCHVTKVERNCIELELVAFPDVFKSPLQLQNAIKTLVRQLIVAGEINTNDSSDLDIRFKVKTPLTTGNR